MNLLLMTVSLTKLTSGYRVEKAVNMQLSITDLFGKSNERRVVAR